jgi:two-component system, OmpR family, response regulator
MEKKRILIVDDEPTSTRMTKLVLEQTGDYEVGEENDSVRALATARVFRPDIILLDVVMPKLDGGDLASLIQADPVLGKVPIVFLTALMERGDAGPEVRGGFRFISKMASKDELITCIETSMVKR